VHADSIPANKIISDETIIKEQKQEQELRWADVWEFVLLLGKSLVCIIFWSACWFYSSQPKYMQQKNQNKNCAALLCEN
jgi:hypothetical protein